MKRKQFLVVAAVVGILLVGMKLLSTPAVKPDEAAELVKSGKAILVDVREPSEWESGVAAPAELLPTSDLFGSRAKWKPFLTSLGDREVLVYCRSGKRAALVSATLSREGIRARNAGSFSAWAGAGLEMRMP